MLALYAEVREESAPRLAVVTGDAGMGKSRSASRLAERLRGDDALWLLGGGDVAQPGAPFGALHVALRRELGVRPGTSPEERRKRIVDRLRVGSDASAAERRAPFIAQLAGTPLDEADSGRVQAVRADAMAMNDALRAAWQDFLEAEGRTRPVVLVLEDMQWGDRPSMSLALAALRALTSTPLWVIVTGRPDVFSVFASSQAVRGRHARRLARSARARVERLLREELPTQDDATLERVAQQAGGNPFLIEELARASRKAAAPGAETVLATAQARLLSALARRATRPSRRGGPRRRSRTTVSPRSSSISIDERAHRAHRRVVREEILERDASRSAATSLSSGRPARGAYASLTETDKKLAHALAASWLTARGGADHLSLATHFERAGNAARGVRALRRRRGAVARRLRPRGRARPPRARRSVRRRRRDARQACSSCAPTSADGAAITRTMRDCATRAAKLLPEGSKHWLAAKVNEAMSRHCSATSGRRARSGRSSASSSRAATSPARRSRRARAPRHAPAVPHRHRRAEPTRAHDLGGDAAVQGRARRRHGPTPRSRRRPPTATTSRTRWTSARRRPRASGRRATCATRATRALNTALHADELGQYARAEAELREGLAVAERSGSPRDGRPRSPQPRPDPRPPRRLRRRRGARARGRARLRRAGRQAPHRGIALLPRAHPPVARPTRRGRGRAAPRGAST